MIDFFKNIIITKMKNEYNKIERIMKFIEDEESIIIYIDENYFKDDSNFNLNDVKLLGRKKIFDIIHDIQLKKHKSH